MLEDWKLVTAKPSDLTFSMNKRESSDPKTGSMCNGIRDLCSRLMSGNHCFSYDICCSKLGKTCDDFSCCLSDPRRSTKGYTTTMYTTTTNDQYPYDLDESDESSRFFDFIGAVVFLILGLILLLIIFARVCCKCKGSRRSSLPHDGSSQVDDVEVDAVVDGDSIRLEEPPPTYDSDEVSVRLLKVPEDPPPPYVEVVGVQYQRPNQTATCTN